MVHARRENPVSDCPLTAALAAVGGKWKMILVFHLAEAPRHFSALRRLISEISPKVLTEQLGELVADEIVQRDSSGTVPNPVMYSLTDYGRSVLPLVENVRAWGNAHIERFSGAALADAL